MQKQNHNRNNSPLSFFFGQKKRNKKVPSNHSANKSFETNNINVNIHKEANKKASNDGHLDILDGFRGIAIILVVWFHVWQQSWRGSNINIFGFVLKVDIFPVCGFLGVELFFFISGFCLFYPFARSKFENKTKPSVAHYAYRRFIKIVPSYYLSLLIMYLFFKPDYLNGLDLMSAILKNVFFLSSFYPDALSINGVIWSLSVEVQFYVIFPLICMLFLKRPFLVFTITNIFAFGYRYYVRVYQADHMSELFNQLPGMIDLFIGGMLAAYIVVLIRSKLSKNEGIKFVKAENFKFIMTGISAGGVVIFLFMLNWLYDIRYSGVQLWQIQNRQFLAWIFIITITAGCFAFKEWRKLFANPVFVFLSVISYNLYIWHQFIAVKLKNSRIPPYQGDFAQSDTTWQWQYSLLSYATAVIIAAFITYFFEKPLLKYGFIGCYDRLKNMKIVKRKLDK